MICPDKAKKSWRRIGIICSFAFLICSGIFFIGPIHKYNSSMVNGTCRVDSLSWQKLWCSEGALEYYVPVISAEFRHITHTGYEDTTYKGLYIDKDHQDKTTGFYATIFDDGSPDGLIECADNSNLQEEISLLLAENIPSLQTVHSNGTEFNASGLLYPPITTYYTNMTFFECFFSSWDQALFISYEAPIEALSAIFAVALVLHILMSHVMVKFDNQDDLFMQIATATMFLVYLIHMALYVPVSIACSLLAGKELMDPEEAFKKGSIFFPIIWLFKKLFKCCGGCKCSCLCCCVQNGSEASPSPPPPARRTPPPIVEPPDHSPRPRQDSPRPRQPSAPGISSSPPLYNDLVIENESTLPPPPSYDEVFKSSEHSRV